MNGLHEEDVGSIAVRSIDGMLQSVDNHGRLLVDGEEKDVQIKWNKFASICHSSWAQTQAGLFPFLLYCRRIGQPSWE